MTSWKNKISLIKPKKDRNLKREETSKSKKMPIKKN
jgi:hypothetical protein